MSSWFEEVIRGSFWESLAVRETGRMPTMITSPGARIVICPKSLTLKDLICPSKFGEEKQSINIALPGRRTAGPGGLIKRIRYLSLWLESCREMELYLFSDDDIGWLIWVTLGLARLKGRRVTLHDYRLVSDSRQSQGLLSSLAAHRVFGDATGLGDGRVNPAADSVRLFNDKDLAIYRACRKERAVPDVLVYGDFEKGPALSLARRAHDMVKEKYPRTMFTLVSLRENSIPGGDAASMRSVTLADEAGIRSLYADTDILLLLSLGGINRYFAGRARAAGIPVIANGFDPFSSGGVEKSIIVPRDSYSALAGEIIRLVDDDAHYRTFAS